MTIKEFVNNFDISRPSWEGLPKDFPNCDLRYLSLQEVGLFNSVKTVWELAHPPKSTSVTRKWTDPEGYRFLIIWTNSVLLRILVRKFTSTLPSFRTPYNPLNSSKPSEHRLKAQLDDAARSVVANIEEGFKRPTTKEYLEFLGFSQASLEEVKGDIKRANQDGFLKSQPGGSLLELGISLQTWKEWCQNPLNSSPPAAPDAQHLRAGKLLYYPLKESKGIYRNLEELKGEALNYEIFIELINKTDKAFRTLVESLERK